MKSTETNSQHEIDARLKERMNFAKMLDRQEQQIQSSPVMDLIRPTDKNEKQKKEQSLSTSQSDLLRIEKEISTRLDRIENVLKLFRKKENTQKEKRVFKFKIENPKALYILAASLVITSLILKLIPTKGPQVITKEKIVYKADKNAHTHIATKFINLRSTPSGQATKLVIISPNSYISILENKGPWKKITFKDNVKNKLYTGWVYGENIKKI